MKKKLFITLGVILMSVIAVASCFYINTYKSADVQLAFSKKEIHPKKIDHLQNEWSSAEFEQAVGLVNDNIKSTWNSSGKVWSETDFSNYQVLILPENEDGSIQETVYLIDSDRRINQVPYEEIKVFNEKSIGSPFFKPATNKLNGIPTMTLSIEGNHFTEENLKYEISALPKSIKPFVYATHEQFHSFQSDWKLKDLKEMTDFDSIENKSEVKQARLEVLFYLQKAILDEKDREQNIAKAKGWWEKYKESYPDVYKGAYKSDMLEGTAQYFDLAMNVRANTGMDAPKETLEKKYQEAIQTYYFVLNKKDLKAEGMDFLRDSYDLGAAAGILLELLDKKDWQQEVMDKGTLPQEILFQDYHSETPQSTPAIKALAESIN
ncbi:hypothetical protein D920_01908 [Enterococcus faecalis 13-SD-W-01]|nr:hypothetical protein D920_01908 [Enterococcus faecalis 13-SD-W-01]